MWFHLFPPGFYLENFFIGGSLNNEYGLYGRARSKREDFAKSAWRDIIDPFQNTLLSFGSNNKTDL